MVYYQSTPLIIKSEQPIQAQYCTQLRSAPNTTSSTPIEQQTTTRNYTSNDNDSNLILLQQPQQQQQSINIKNSLSEPNASYITNIKSDQLQTPRNALYTNGTTQATTSSLASSNSFTTLIQQSSQNNSDYNGSGGNPELAAAKLNPNLTAVITTGIGRKSMGNKQQFKCDQCGMKFGSKSAHTSHTKSHAKSAELISSSSVTNVGAVDVSESGVPLGIPKTPQIKPYANGVLGADPYQCNVCHKTFAVPARLIRHYRTHTGERPFECEFCHKLFSVKENLQVHRRIHTKERPYKCDVCGRAFEHSGKLHRHMRIHTGERPHKCSVCEKTFIQSGQLVIHMRTHTGEKPYKCPVEGCGKGFTCSKQLKVHSRTHTGEKPYHCDICFRDFGYNHVLKLHRVQHYGSKCYKCTICDETFKSKKEMEAHIKGHANELPDEEESTTNGVTISSNGQQISLSSSSSGEGTSAPSSPQSPVSNADSIKIKKPKQTRSRSNFSGATVTVEPSSPSSPRSTFSPTSSLASASRLSTSSPVSSVASPVMSLNFETDHHSRDSGVASTSNNRQLLSSTPSNISNSNNSNNSNYNSIIEMPTDLSIQHQIHHQQSTTFYEQQNINNSYQYGRLSPDPSIATHQTQYQTHNTHSISLEVPTINPALIEAASIVSSRDMIEPREEEVTQAALQIMQLHRSQKQQQQHRALLMSDEISQYDDTHEANELIEHYKRGDLARHGLHKRYAPVPKFESSLLNNEIIVRQVEAAIAPLRSSTESPERSSSPESDSMMMADRDIMTLPLRKRKLYMNDDPRDPRMTMEVQQHYPLQSQSIKNINGGGVNAGNSNNNAIVTNGSENNMKVMRLSSVIQFAKAS